MPLARGEGDTPPGHPTKDASGRWREGDGGAASTETLSNTIGHEDRALAWQSNATRTYKQRETPASKHDDLSKPPQTTPGITHTPEFCLQPVAQTGSVASPSNPPPQRGMVQPQSTRPLRQKGQGTDLPAARRQLLHKLRERGPTLQMLHATIWGIGEATPIDAWGEPHSLLGVPYDAV
jgi:hypothetical protein